MSPGLCDRDAAGAPGSERAPTRGVNRFSGALFVLGALCAIVAASVRPGAAASAASQDWSPFVLVAGLLMVGMVAAEDGVFEAAGSRLDALARGALSLYAGSMALVAVVSALLNLDTAVTFMTPVALAAAKRRRHREPSLGPHEPGPGLAMLYGCLLVANAASLVLPGSNITNLIVLGHLHLSGSAFAGRTAPAWAAGVLVTASAVAFVFRRGLVPGAQAATDPREGEPHPTPGPLGLAAVIAVTALVLALSSPALPVLATGALALALRGRRHARGGAGLHEGAASRARAVGRAAREVSAPALVALFGLAVGAGALGRAWDGPSRLLAHLDGWGTAALAAVLSVAVNNLPAASLLSARALRHPFAALVGLDLGPNLLVSGSLSSVLWWQAARRSGWRPSIGVVSRLGALSVPPALAAAVGILMASGHR